MLMMMTGNLVGFVIGTDGMKYLASEIFGTWYGTCSCFRWSHTRADTDLRLAISRGSVWSVVHRCAIDVRVQRGGDAPWSIPKILRTVSVSFVFAPTSERMRRRNPVILREERNCAVKPAGTNVRHSLVQEQALGLGLWKWLSYSRTPGSWASISFQTRYAGGPTIANLRLTMYVSSLYSTFPPQ